MPTFTLAPKISTPIEVMSTLPIAFAALAKPTPSSTIALPFDSVFDRSSLSVRDDDDCDSDSESNDEGSSKTPPGHGGTPPGQAKKACRTSTSSAAMASTSTMTSNPQSPTPTTPPSLQTALTSPGVTASQSTQAPSATSRDGSSASTDGRSLDSQESTTGPGTSAPSSTSASSPSTPLTGSTASASGTPAANLSTPSPPTTSSVSSATAPPAGDHDLSVASAVGIAFGVFAVTAILVSGAVALFLFLRKRRRKRRRRRDDSASERKLASSEGAPSRPLSSTWSWFGSVAIGSEHDPEPDPQHTVGQHPRDLDPFLGLGGGTEKSATGREPIVPPLALHEVEVEFVQDVPNLTRSSAGASADDASDRPWGTPETLDGVDVDAEEQRVGDPFADPECSWIIDVPSIKGNSDEVESVNVR